MMDEALQNQLEQTNQSLDLSRGTLTDLQKADRIRQTAEAIKLQSYEDLANYLRAEIENVRKLSYQMNGQIQEQADLTDKLIQLRNSLIEEYEIQQAITATMQDKPESIPEQRIQQIEQAVKPNFRDFLSRG